MGIRANRMITSAPAYYEYSKLHLAVQNAIADDLDNSEINDADLQLQLYIPTATWGLKYWEYVLDLPTVVTDSYSVRRSRVLGMWRGIGNFSAKMLEAVAQAFTPYPVHVRIRIRDFMVLAVFDEDLPENLADFKKQAFRIIHAHLGLNYRVRIFRKTTVELKNKHATVLRRAISTNPWNKNDTPLKFDGSATFDGTYFFTGDYDDYGPTMAVSLVTKVVDARQVTPLNIAAAAVKLTHSHEVPVAQSYAVSLKLAGIVHNWKTFNGGQTFDGSLSFDNDLINHVVDLRVISKVIKITDTVHNWETFDGEHEFDGTLNFDNDLIKHVGTLRLRKGEVMKVYDV